MQQLVADLLHQLELERLEVNLFRGESRDFGSPQVYGGQVLGQALRAAYATIDDGRIVHSLHAYFLRRGDFNLPIVYSVDRSRDGSSYSSRRVVAIQKGEQIFHLAASFQVPEQGFEHQMPMPQVPGPADLPDLTRLPETIAERLPDKVRNFLQRQRPFEFRMVQPIDLLTGNAAPAHQQVWVRLCDQIEATDEMHRCLLAYIADFGFLNVATLPHGSSYAHGDLFMASLDHAMWFHRKFRVDQWLLYDMDSPSASGGRGLARGSFYAADGALVASTAQEGLIRFIDAKR
ncbi:MAG: acyl-CoA thioesterase II [Steroidobacteraceae bacterium]